MAGFVQSRIAAIEEDYQGLLTLPEGDHRRGTRLLNCYDSVERVLLELLKKYKIEVDSEAAPDGTHRYHDNLISAFADPKMPLYRHLGSGPIQGVLWDCKKFRNSWTRPMTQIATDELMPQVRTITNGMPLVIKALKEARATAGVA